MHSDMGDERGIRLRCICLGDAALRGSRMSARGLCGKGSESRIARSSLSIARSSVCAALGVCVLTSQHFVRDAYENLVLTVHLIDTHSMIADILTKAMPKVIDYYKKFRDIIMDVVY